jgi:hypothetical protein
MKGRQRGRPTKRVLATVREPLPVGKPGVTFEVWDKWRRKRRKLGTLTVTWAGFDGGLGILRTTGSGSGSRSPIGSRRAEFPRALTRRRGRCQVPCAREEIPWGDPSRRPSSSSGPLRSAASRRGDPSHEPGRVRAAPAGRPDPGVGRSRDLRVAGGHPGREASPQTVAERGAATHAHAGRIGRKAGSFRLARQV